MKKKKHRKLTNLRSFCDQPTAGSFSYSFNKLNKGIVDSCSKPVFLLLISRLPVGVRLKYRHPRKAQTQGNDWRPIGQ